MQAPRWWLPVALVCLVLSAILMVVYVEFWALAVVTFVLGILLAVRHRTGAGAAMIILAIVGPIGGALLIELFVAKPYRIPSASMEPTLRVGDHILVNRTGIGGFSVGDIVVFHPPAGAEQELCGAVHPPGSVCDMPLDEAARTFFVKRIVAGPGDTIAVIEGHVYRNGKRESDPYIRPCGESPECNYRTPVRVPPGDWFMMGDNRGDSDDSRLFGPVPAGWIVGRPFLRVAP